MHIQRQGCNAVEIGVSTPIMTRQAVASRPTQTLHLGKAIFLPVRSSILKYKLKRYT
jgi:hypothetical protein